MLRLSIESAEDGHAADGAAGEGWVVIHEAGGVVKPLGGEDVEDDFAVAAGGR